MKIKPPTKQELRDFVIVAFVFAFIFSFNEWGAEKFEFWTGVVNFVIALVIVTLSLGLHHFGQRLYAARHGLEPEQKIWWTGILIALFLAIFSNGKIMFFAATGLFVSHISAARLGRFFYKTKTSTIGAASLAGIVFTVTFGVLLKLIQLWFAPGFLIADKILLFTLLFAFANMLPIPPLDGSRVFFASRTLYVFALGVVAGYLGLAYFLGVYSIIWSLAIGAGAWILFYLLFETFWKPFG